VPHRLEVSWHTWHADLTAVPISGGFWTNWIPNAIWQRWPVCWWVLNVIDHYSRRSMGFAAFKCRPTSEGVTAALDRIMSAEQVQPKHLIVDQGPEFNCEHFKDVWCKAKGILPRFGAVGKHGSIAVVERFHRTMKGDPASDRRARGPITIRTRGGVHHRLVQ
jgi:transposase InsO family protein